MKRVLLLLFVTVFVLSPVFAEEKTGFTDLKSKIAIGCSVTGSSASVRFWPSDNLGVELSAGLSFANNYVHVPISAAMLFPIMEKGNFALNIAPGIGFSYTMSSSTVSGFSFSAGADLMVEMALPIISENLSIGSAIGAWFAFASSTNSALPTNQTTTSFNVDLVTVSPVVLRYYF